MYVDDDQQLTAALSLRVYGASASSVRSDIDSIMGVASGNNPVRSNETGVVEVKSEINTTAQGVDCQGGSGSECDLICIIIVAIVMAVFALVWAAVMIVFSIVTFGGFIKRRYRTLVLVEKKNQEFLGKLAVLVSKRDSAMDYHFGHPQYDDWVDDTFGLFMKKKYIRQFAMALGFGWGLVEIAYKIPNLLDPNFHYDLWPLRYVMILVFTPLILYSPFMEWRFRGAFNLGDEMVTRLVHEYPSYAPEHRMQFVTSPQVLAIKPRLSLPKSEKKKAENQESDQSGWE